MLHHQKKKLPFLRATQQTDLMTLPWMHFHLLAAGTYDRTYLHTLTGLFNIGTTLADLRRDKDVQREMDAGQSIMVNLLMDDRGPKDEEVESLSRVLHIADRFVRKQRKTDLVKALDYLDKRLAAADGKWHREDLMAA